MRKFNIVQILKPTPQHIELYTQNQHRSAEATMLVFCLLFMYTEEAITERINGKRTRAAKGA